MLVAAPPQPEKLIITPELRKEWIKNPVRYVEDAICPPKISNQQRDALEGYGKLINARLRRKAIADGYTSIPLTVEEEVLCRKFGMSIQSGKGVGKNAFSAWVTFHFLDCMKPENIKIMYTAPTEEQLKNNLWSEMHKWLQLSPYLRDMFTYTSEKIYLTEYKGASVYAAWKTCAKSANPTDQKPTMAGKHADYMILGMDEACHDDQTDILTEGGWARFADYQQAVHGRILTLDRKTGEATYHWPTHIHRYPWDGEMYRYRSRVASFQVTPKHEMYYRAKVKGDWRWFQRPIQEVRANKMFIPRTCEWKGEEQETFRFPQPLLKRPLNQVITGEWEAPMDSWLAFLGWFFSEGSLGFSPKQDAVCVGISQSEKNSDHCEDIGATIKGLGLPVKFRKGLFRIHSSQLARYLLTFGRGCLEKRIPRWVMGLSPRQISIFLDRFHRGDGYWHAGKRVFYTSCQGLADDLQELIVLAGGYATKKRRTLEGKRHWIQDHWGTSSTDGFVVAESSRPKAHLTVRRENIEKVHYHGDVFCMTVPPNNLLYTRRDGACMWSGNSGIPDNDFSPIESTMTGPVNLAIVTFNPTKSIGYAIRTQTTDARYWLHYQWNAEESDIVEPDHIIRYQEKYGRDSNMYRINILGLPPKSDSMTVIPYEWAESCVGLEFAVDEDDLMVAGLDVAGGGQGSDSTVLVVGEGGMVKKDGIFRTNLLRDREIAEWALDHWHARGLHCIAVDVNGLGSGVANDLERIGGRYGLDVLRVQVGRTPEKHPDRFERLRDELWWDGREAFEHAMVSIPNQEDLLGELTTPKYEPYRGAQAKIKVQSKKEMLKSPDTADAWLLWYYAWRKRGKKPRPSLHRGRRARGRAIDWRVV